MKLTPESTPLRQFSTTHMNIIRGVTKFSILVSFCRFSKLISCQIYSLGFDGESASLGITEKKET